MKNRKKLLALVMALSLCASLAGCAASEDNSSTASVPEAETTAAEETAAAETTLAEETAAPEAETAAPTEEETVDSNTLSAEYAYYELLAEEWENTPKNRYDQGSTNIGAFQAEDGKIYIWSNNMGLYSYDPATKEAKNLIFKENRTSSYYFYVNGYFYYIDNGQFEPIRKYDTDGNLIAESTMQPYYSVVLDSGEIICTDGNTFIYKLSSDLQSYTEIPSPQREAAHGLSDNVEINYFYAQYGNKVYAWAMYSSETWVLDVDTLEWEVLEKEWHWSSSSTIIGKYYFGTDSYNTKYLYDMETGKLVTEIKTSSSRNFDYSGGTCSTICENNRWFRGRYSTRDASNIEVVLEMPDTENQWSVYGISDTQYVLVDDYGIFLRTYEGGADGEETIYLFKN